MALTFRNIKKWWKMIRHKSILHVNQGPGKCYSFERVEGYFNDLTEKVTKDTKTYNSVCPMTTIDDRGKELCYPVVVFQYGLGAYDLFLLKVDEDLMKQKFLCQLEWALANQNNDGSWDNFGPLLPDFPFSSMAQGEGASLLIRGYKMTGKKEYLDAAKKALDFMIVDLKNGGTARYIGDDIYFYEFTCYPFVFNGWIFLIFGLIDYYIETKDAKYKIILDKTISTLKNNLCKMDNGYWSMYRDDKTIASPFYHDLHIAQLKVLYSFTKDSAFQNSYLKFETYKSKRWNRTKAFWVKAFQKIFRK